ncbi:MAG: hypothetical protein U1E40_16215 [Amaricoccus sp.]
MTRLRNARAAIRKAAGAPGAAIAARPRLARWLLAGPIALLASLATMLAMPFWLPAGAGGVDDIVLPIVLTPLLWAIPFFYACLEPDLPRCAAVLVGLTLGQALVVAVATG